MTGSCHLLEADDTRLLLDSGLYQGGRDRHERNLEPVPLEPAELDGVVLPWPNPLSSEHEAEVTVPLRGDTQEPSGARAARSAGSVVLPLSRPEARARRGIAQDWA